MISKKRFADIHPRIFVVVLLAVYLLNGIFYLQRQSITFDEGSHLDFGIRILKGSTSREGDPAVLNSKMPVSALNALPRAVEQLLHPGLKRTDQGVADILHGRYITLLVSILIGLYVYKWSRDLYGERAGLFSLFLFVFCPNCLAHAGLVTTDTYSVLLLLTVMYYLWKYLSEGGRRNFLLFCVLTGVAQLAKQSLFHLYVLLPCLLLLYFLCIKKRSINARAFLQKATSFLLINLLVINAGFFFQGFGTSLGEYHFMSHLFQGLQQHLSFMKGLPLPLPASYVEGMDMAKFYDQLGGGLPGSSFGNVTVLGHSSTGGSLWYYYFVVCFFKTPIAILFFLAWSFSLLIRRESFDSVVRHELFLLFPVLYFFILMDFFYKSQTNIRQIIFIYPLLYIFCGILFRYLRTVREKGSLVFLSMFYLVSVLLYFRDYIPYTNELVWDKKMAWQKVGAANLDFGQGGLILKDYLRDHPGLVPASSEARPGRQYIDVSNFLDIWNLHRYDWLKPFRPVGHIAHYYLIFDISADQLK